MLNQKTQVTRHVLTFTKTLLVTCGLSFAVGAQTSATDGSTPLGLQPGAPAGSYALSGFDNVNLYNGNLSFQLSLLGVSGRGGAQNACDVANRREVAHRGSHDSAIGGRGNPPLPADSKLVGEHGTKIQSRLNGRKASRIW